MTNLSRRSLLTGLLSSAAVIAAGPVAKVIPPCDLFKSSLVAADLEFLEGLSQTMLTTIWYGVPISPLDGLDFFNRAHVVGTFPRNSDAGMVFSEVA